MKIRFAFFFFFFFQTTISIKRDFYLHATRSLINVLAWIYYRRYCCAYFAEDLRARVNARGRSRRAREPPPGEFSRALQNENPKRWKRVSSENFSRLLISKMIKNRYIFPFLGPELGKKFFFTVKLKKIIWNKSEVSHGVKKIVWKLIGFYWKLFVQLKKIASVFVQDTGRYRV